MAITWLVTISFVLVGLMLLATDVPPANGWGCVLVALSTIPGDLNDPHFAASSLSVVGFILEPLYLVAASALVLRYPDRSLSRSSRRILAALLVTGFASRLGAAVTTGDMEDDFYRPPSWATPPLPAWMHDDVFVSGGRAAAAALLFVVVGLLAQRLRHAHGLTRQSQAAMVVIGILCAVAAAMDQLVWAVGTETARAIPAALVRNLSAALIPVALLVDLLRRRAAAAAVSQQVLTAALTGDATQLQEAVQDIFVDPTATVELSDHQGGWIDVLGRPIHATDPHERRYETLTVDDDTLALRIGFDRHAVHDETLLATVVTAIRVGTHNSQLRTDLMTALAEVTSARERLVAASLAERRKFERNLHDGAQQQLLAVAATLAQSDLIADAALRDVVVDARAALGQALAELRSLARGIHPAVLSQGGLAAALPMLADRAPWPVTLRLELGVAPLPEIAEASAYFLVAELLTNAARHAHATAAQVQIAVKDESMEIDVSDDGAGGARVVAGGGLAGLRDRVEALGGSLNVADRHGGRGTVAHATMPLRSAVPQ